MKRLLRGLIDGCKEGPSHSFFEGYVHPRIRPNCFLHAPQQIFQRIEVSRESGLEEEGIGVAFICAEEMLAAHDVVGSRLAIEAHRIPFCPRAKFLKTCRDLIRQLADDSRVKEWLHLDRPREVQLLGLGFGRLVPFLQDLGKGCSVDIDKLLQLVQIVRKLLETLL